MKQNGFSDDVTIKNIGNFCRKTEFCELLMDRGNTI